MTRGMILAVLASVFVGLAIGSVAGRSQGIAYSHMLDQTEAIFLSEITARFSAKQFKYADNAHARDAALLEIKILRLLERSHPDAASQHQLAAAYVRLSLIEETVGQKGEEQQALDQARVYFKRIHPGEQLTDDEMKNTVRQMDESLARLGW